MLSLYAWCNRARDYDRKWKHSAMHPQSIVAPSEAILLAGIINEKPENVLTDDVLKDIAEAREMITPVAAVADHSDEEVPMPASPDESSSSTSSSTSSTQNPMGPDSD